MQYPLSRFAFAALLLPAVGGCSVIAVAGTAASVAVTGASLAVDATVGTVKLVGKAAGAATDAVLPSRD